MCPTEKRCYPAKEQNVRNRLEELLEQNGSFQGYAYAYPHKLAYRPITPARSVHEVWADEDRRALFLYAHVPFCEMRCGFCNLLTTTHPEGALTTRYLDAFERQAAAVMTALGPNHQFARLAIGGGTPTFLNLAELDRLFGIINTALGDSAAGIPKAIEASPATVDREKIAFLIEQGITRMSLGVQSFDENEVQALGRRQRTDDVRCALGLMAGAGIDCINIDLIYGIPGQTVGSWKCSLEQALEFAPQEIYLYPLYVRPLTGLGRNGSNPTDERLTLYRAGRELLRARGYQQVSMRLFRSSSCPLPEAPIYCCQDDGMVGLGVGARSYTRAMHYSTEYAVGRAGVMEIIHDYCARSASRFEVVDYGCMLDATEQRRRYAIKTLLRAEGLNLTEYRAQFSSDAMYDLSQLNDLLAGGFATHEHDRLVLTSRGLECSDVIGPWLFSPAMRERMEDFALT